jgi:hypothetical protein
MYCNRKTGYLDRAAFDLKAVSFHDEVDDFLIVVQQVKNENGSCDSQLLVLVINALKQAFFLLRVEAFKNAVLDFNVFSDVP